MSRYIIIECKSHRSERIFSSQNYDFSKTRNFRTRPFVRTSMNIEITLVLIDREDTIKKCHCDCISNNTASCIHRDEMTRVKRAIILRVYRKDREEMYDF